MRRWRENGTVESKWPTSFWAQAMASRDFFVGFTDVDMPAEFCWPSLNFGLSIGLAIFNFPGGAVESFGHAHFRHPLIIEFFTGPDVYTEFQEFSCMFRPPKRHLLTVKQSKKVRNK